jgi:hypothetical protein
MRKYIQADTRGRVYLGSDEAGEIFIMDIENDGVITLTPAVVVPRPAYEPAPEAPVEGTVTKLPLDSRYDLVMRYPEAGKLNRAA